MRSGDRFIAGHFGLRNGRQLMLGILSHSPFLAEFSPGRFHIWYMALELARQGIHEIDLTPGGDEYKQKLATHTEQAYTITVYFDRTEYWRAITAAYIRSTAKLFISKSIRKFIAKYLPIAAKTLERCRRIMQSGSHRHRCFF
jgi:CelD/BcsL family acetyltransferase involved in cellulose biosynthesis